ncbi:hypothetical protein AYI70_g10936 [Smittium culicis]|uniref:Uncharacterized protein n=1 Tax=Smittium culicis TaxID=133412 RepID=A0A1R1X443_9FUNG|nr:hypothetical protein AYI70_g10936 [Smittium culicis]
MYEPKHTLSSKKQLPPQMGIVISSLEKREIIPKNDHRNQYLDLGNATDELEQAVKTRNNEQSKKMRPH